MSIYTNTNQQLRSDYWARALEYIPNGCQTMSKSPDRYVNGVYPKLLLRGDGCMVTDTDHRDYVDYIGSLGAILFGYNNKTVNAAVKETISDGQVLLSFSSPKEGALAERLHNIIPCAQKTKFFKTGSDALSAAVRVVRAYTGKEKVAICGYHGWHDWYQALSKQNAGVPKALTDLISRFKYNDLQSLADCLSKGDVAAVIMEPVVYDEPKDNFIKEVVRLAHEHDALVVFDEVITGFRFGLSGAMGRFGVSPDLACFSKAMGNGYPIAALCGFDEYMKVYANDDFFVSGTFGGDLIGISAAIAVIDALRISEERQVKDIWSSGQMLKDSFNSLCKIHGIQEISCKGFPPRTMFDFPTMAHKALFWQECIKQNVLFGYANFITSSHLPGVIQNTMADVDVALRVVKDNWNDPAARLEGEMPKEIKP